MTTIHDLTRRSFLAMAGAMPLAVSAFAQNRRVPVGLELYSVRGELMRDLPATVTAVARMGYEVVEFYSPYFSWTPTQAREVRTLLNDLGITCRSTHNGIVSFTPDGLPKAIELNQILGSQAIILASPPRITDLNGWKALGAQMTEVTERLKPMGLSAGFHNHGVEWRPLEGQRPMDVLAASTPRDFILQFDVGTCVEAGADPVAWIRANPGRIKSMHCKDWGAGEGRGYAVAFGEGDVPWRDILTAAEATGGIEYYLVEQEVAGPQGELAMARRCLDNWKALRG